MHDVINAIDGEFRRYKQLTENAVAQLSDDNIHVQAGNGNSVATLIQHLAGNLKSRFTDFLTTDGEKPSRDRDAEFTDKELSRDELLRSWEDGWEVLFGTLAALQDDQLPAMVTIRGASLSVMEALTRSLAHASYHAGQIVLIARTIRGSEWKYLSIPPRSS